MSFIGSVRVLVVALFVAVSLPLRGAPPAAAASRTEVWLMSLITEVRPAADGGVDVILPRGARHGLVVGTRGNVYVRAEDGGIGDVLARIELVEVGPDTARGHAAPGPLVRLDQLAPGQPVEVSAAIASDVHRGPLFQLALLGVTFLNNMGQPIASLDDLLGARDDALEARALATMVGCGQDVAELTLEMKAPVKRGKWRDAVLADVLRQSGPDDYRAFLRFARDFPGKYIGKDWKISETFATWIVNDAPPSEDDRLAELMAASGAAFTALAREQKDDAFAATLRHHRFAITNWSEDKNPEGWRVLSTFERAAKARGKAPLAVRAELLHIRARLLDNEPRRTQETARAYEQLAPLYFQLGTPIEAFVALNNVVSQLYQAERYDDVLERVPGVLATLRREGALITDPQIAAHVPAKEAFLIQLTADIAKRRGQYREVVAQLTPLIGRFEAAGYPRARQDELSLLSALAGAHTKLGEYDAARGLYGHMERLAEVLDDDARRADVAWELGDLDWAQSRWLDAAAQYARMAELARAAASPAREAKALAAEAQALWSVGRHADALAKHEVGLALREATADQSGVAWQLVQMGKILVETGDRDRARALFERALATRLALGEQGGEAEVREQLGELELALTRLDAARAHFEAARVIYARLKLAPDEARTLQGLARVQLKLGSFRDAAKTIGKSVELFKKSGEITSLAGAMYWQARVVDGAGGRVEARGIRERALAIAKGDPALRAEGLTDLGWRHLGDGELAVAEARAREALALAEAVQDVVRRVRALALLEEIGTRHADFDGALATNARRLTLALESGNRPEHVSALVDRAWKLVDIGRLADARATLDEALPIARQNGDEVALAWVFNAYARVHEHYGDAREEVAALDEAVRLVERANYPYGIAALVYNRSLLSVRLRDLERALSDNLRAEALGGVSLDVQFRVPLLFGRGSVLRYLRRFGEARQALDKAVALARTAAPDRVPEGLRELGRLHEQEGRVEQAVATLREAAALEDQRAGRQFGALAELGIVLAAAGRDADAAAPLTEALARARERGGVVPWEALYQLGLIRARAGQRDAAVALLLEAVGEVERGEVLLTDDDARSRYRADKTGVYRYLIKLLLGQGKVEDALRYLERSKVSELAEVDRRAGTGGDPATALATELDVQEGRLQKLLDAELTHVAPDHEKVSRLDSLLASVKRRRAAFTEKLDRNDALFDRYTVRPIQLEKLQQYLADDMLVLAPVLLDDQVVVFAVSRTVLTHFTRAAPAGRIAALVAEFARQVDPRRAEGAQGVASLAKVTGLARELYDLLVRPAFEAVGRPKTLIVSASGPLRYVPFAALHDGERWLVERTQVVNVTALDREKFADQSPRGRAGATVIALADPDGTLPGARAEVAEVQKAYAGVDVFEGKDATLAMLRAKVRVPGYDIVHFATHGRLDTDNPEQSNILLAGGSLSYVDIPTLSPARTHLVVLSACQTAVHTGGTGVEIAGLAYQFQRSKVDSVLATLWEVDDEATSQLMSRFYRELAQGRTYVEGLALAQRYLIGDKELGFGHPAYWAPFFLMGTP